MRLIVLVPACQKGTGPSRNKQVGDPQSLNVPVAKQNIKSRIVPALVNAIGQAYGGTGNPWVVMASGHDSDLQLSASYEKWFECLGKSRRIVRI
jgi:hypothetical protein